MSIPETTSSVYFLDLPAEILVIIIEKVLLFESVHDKDDNSSHIIVRTGIDSYNDDISTILPAMGWSLEWRRRLLELRLVCTTFATFLTADAFWRRFYITHYSKYNFTDEHLAEYRERSQIALFEAAGGTYTETHDTLNSSSRTFALAQLSGNTGSYYMRYSRTSCEPQYTDIRAMLLHSTGSYKVFNTKKRGSKDASWFKNYIFEVSRQRMVRCRNKLTSMRRMHRSGNFLSCSRKSTCSCPKCGSPHRTLLDIAEAEFCRESERFDAVRIYVGLPIRTKRLFKKARGQKTNLSLVWTHKEALPETFAPSSEVKLDTWTQEWDSFEPAQKKQRHNANIIEHLEMLKTRICGNAIAKNTI